MSQFRIKGLDASVVDSSDKISRPELRNSHLSNNSIKSPEYIEKVRRWLVNDIFSKNQQQQQQQQQTSSLEDDEKETESIKKIERGLKAEIDEIYNNNRLYCTVDDEDFPKSAGCGGVSIFTKIFIRKSLMKSFNTALIETGHISTDLESDEEWKVQLYIDMIYRVGGIGSFRDFKAKLKAATPNGIYTDVLKRNSLFYRLSRRSSSANKYDDDDDDDDHESEESGSDDDEYDSSEMLRHYHQWLCSEPIQNKLLIQYLKKYYRNTDKTKTTLDWFLHCHDGGGGGGDHHESLFEFLIKDRYNPTKYKIGGGGGDDSRILIISDGPSSVSSWAIVSEQPNKICIVKKE